VSKLCPTCSAELEKAVDHMVGKTPETHRNIARSFFHWLKVELGLISEAEVRRLATEEEKARS